MSGLFVRRSALIQDYKAEVNNVIIVLSQQSQKGKIRISVDTGLIKSWFEKPTSCKWTVNYAILASKQYVLFTHAASGEVEIAIATAWNL